MAAYITLQIHASNDSVADLNQLLLGGDSTKPREVLEKIRNFLDAIDGGNQPSTITAVSSTVAGTVSGQTGGVSVSLNLA